MIDPKDKQIAKLKTVLRELLVEAWDGWHGCTYIPKAITNAESVLAELDRMNGEEKSETND